MTPAEKTLAAVRSLSEGRAPKRVLNCVPVGTAAPAVRPVTALLPPLPPPPFPGMPQGGGKLQFLLDRFLHVAPDRFSVALFRNFCNERGAMTTRDSAANFFLRQKRLGLIRPVGKQGIVVFYEKTF